MNQVLVIHGPNLNMLGKREQDIYGPLTLEEINSSLEKVAQELGIKLQIFQSNHEGEIVETIQKAGSQCQLIIINPAAYTHTSIAILDALKAIELPAIEVHLSNVYAREAFRHNSCIAPAVCGRIMGFGIDSYLLALRAAKSYLAK